MPTFTKGRRYYCSKCGTLFLPEKPKKLEYEVTCPNCHSKEVTSESNVVVK